MVASIEQHIVQLNSHRTSRLLDACKKVDHFRKSMEPLFEVVNIFVSTHHPEWAGIAWGAIRLVFQVGYSTLVDDISSCRTSCAATSLAFSRNWQICSRNLDVTFRIILPKSKSSTAVSEIRLGVKHMSVFSRLYHLCTLTYCNSVMMPVGCSPRNGEVSFQLRTSKGFIL